MPAIITTARCGSSPHLVLINPRFPESFWSFGWALRELLPRKRAINPPLGLATVAALTPSHWRITILDENVEPLPTALDADVVGICGMAVQHQRQRELLTHYRQRGRYVVAGGAYASLSPEAYTGLVDTLVVGEAERTWPRFCQDFAAGRPRAQYRQHEPVDLRESPTPRFDLLRLDRYTTPSLQFSRGCPFRCEFCDIPLLSGRRPRTKDLVQVGREMDALRAAGVENAFFVDDNLIGHQPNARALFRYLADYQRRADYPLRLGTEASVNLAASAELLDLFRDAGFRWVFLGIETPEPDSLAEAGKRQNLRGDLLETVRAFYRNGIDVFSGFIVGFDHDTVAAFGRLHRFIVDSGIQVAMLGLLTAIPGTPLYQRLAREGRLRGGVAGGDNSGGRTNVEPAGMSYRELVDGYSALWRRLLTNRAILERIRNKRRYFSPVAPRHLPPWQESLPMLRRLIVRGILPGGIGRSVAFAASLAGARPALWPIVVRDWAHALAIRAYARRDLGWTDHRERMRLRRRLARLESRLCRLSPGALTVSSGPGARLRLVVRERLGAVESRRVARQLAALLRRVPSVEVAVRVHTLSDRALPRVRQILESLRRYADRIVVEADHSLVPALDSSVFRIRWTPE
ncbi:MAG TPA: radical SAM protein [Gammaproteobacteria bacterium]|nr:radical SAM protein [Gammaproteobacteria bacterium]